MNFQMLSYKWRQAVSYYKAHGLLSLTRKVSSTVNTSSVAIFRKTDVLGFYDFVLDKPFGKPPAKATSPRTLNWFIPPYGRGSGGHLNIFRFMFLLEKLGFECRVIIVGGHSPYNVAEAKAQISEWFFPLKAEVYDGIEGIPDAEYSVATSWQTAYYVKNFQGTRHKCYFVQDFEPYFYAVGSESAMAEATYSFGFTAITAGTWLSDKLSQEYGAETFPVSFSYERELYRLMPRREPEIKRVFFYARPPTQRRAFELGLLTLHEVVKRLPNVKVIFAGWDVSNYEIPFEHLNAGTLNVAELPDLYNQCDVALVLSFTNLSLLPLELMACGVPVVSNKHPCTEWLLNESNAVLKRPIVEDLADGICELLTNPKLHSAIREEGIKVANHSSWEAEAQKLSDALLHISTSSLRLEQAHASQ
ncbi:glycosyltransferase family 4 protein [Pseudomonas sp. RIT-To-2]|uniref:glycosyltransferase family 4 protein n=1 Tax=Pseudomonas sp. RIT-To-2 TaxID=3462541 RepID=UPI00241337A3